MPYSAFTAFPQRLQTRRTATHACRFQCPTRHSLRFRSIRAARRVAMDRVSMPYSAFTAFPLRR